MEYDYEDFGSPPLVTDFGFMIDHGWELVSVAKINKTQFRAYFKRKAIK